MVPPPSQASSHVAEDPSQAPADRQLATILPSLQDANQLANFQFFIAVGMGIESTFQTPVATDFVAVINGEVCTPCRSELGPRFRMIGADVVLEPLSRGALPAACLGVAAWGGAAAGTSLLVVSGASLQNVKATIQWLQSWAGLPSLQLRAGANGAGCCTHGASCVLGA